MLLPRGSKIFGGRGCPHLGQREQRHRRESSSGPSYLSLTSPSSRNSAGPAQVSWLPSWPFKAQEPHQRVAASYRTRPACRQVVSSKRPLGSPRQPAAPFLEWRFFQASPEQGICEVEWAGPGSLAGDGPPGPRKQTLPSSRPLLRGPGEEASTQSGLLLVKDPHGAGRAPHFDAVVCTGCQEELLFHGAESHRVDHVAMLQFGQADVVVPVPDVSVAILGPTALAERRRPVGDHRRKLEEKLWEHHHLLQNASRD